MCEHNNHLMELRAVAFEEARRILHGLVESVLESRADLVGLEATLARLDALRARARWAKEWGGIALVPEAGALRLAHARHPLLAMGERSAGVVPLDLELGEGGRLLLVSGPNMGGKTVLLKTVGLAVAMAHAALPVLAAEGSTIPPIDEIVVDLGDEQSVDTGLSTFAAHLMRLKAMAEAAGPRSLMLADELGAGTDPEEGAALGRALVEHFAARGAWGVLTTHLGSLKRVASEVAGVVNGSLEFDLDTLTPRFVFLPGVPGASHALSVAGRLGFPAALLARAHELTPDETRALERLLADVGAALAQVRDERVELAGAQAEAEAAAASHRAAAEDSRRTLSDMRRRLTAESDVLLGRSRELWQTVQREARKAEKSRAGVETLRQDMQAIERDSDALQRRALELAGGGDGCGQRCAARTGGGHARARARPRHRGGHRQPAGCRGPRAVAARQLEHPVARPPPGCGGRGRRTGEGGDRDLFAPGRERPAAARSGPAGHGRGRSAARGGPRARPGDPGRAGRTAHHPRHRHGHPEGGGREAPEVPRAGRVAAPGRRARRRPRRDRGEAAMNAFPGGSGARGSDDWVESVRAASDIVEVVGQSVPLRRVGRNFMGVCPFHQEKTPSFSVNAERQFYHCFSCKAGGDVFKFVQETEKVGFLEAVEMLSRRAGIAVPERRSGERGKRAPLLEALDAAAAAYEAWLGDPTTGAAARAYLEKRGIPRETQREFRLGFAPGGWENLVPRLRPRFGDDVLIEARLAGRKEGAKSLFDWFRNRLMVPLIAPGGMVLGFGARTMGDEQPKYLNSPESSVYHKGQFLYGLEQARRHVKADGEVVVVEGYFDAIAMHEAGIRTTVATSGTALTADHARQLRRLARGVALTYDGDAAGQDAMLRSLGVLLAEGLDVAVVDLPAGDDPDTLVRRGGLDGWREVRDSAYDAVEFVQRHILRRGGGGDPRERALQAVVRMLGAVQDTIRLRLLVERASQVFGLSESVIARAVQLARTGQASERPVGAAVASQRRVENDLEKRAVQALLHAPELVEWAGSRLAPEDLVSDSARALAEALWKGEDPMGLEGAAGDLARDLLATSPEEYNWHAEAEGAVRMLKVRALERSRRERRTRLASAQGEAVNRLMAEIDFLSKQIQELRQ